MATLPTPGGDTGTWGSELNTFLLVAHNADGTGKGLPINVQEYGTVGNGIDDDQPAIQDCLDAATDGSEIMFPPGTYLCNAKLQLPSNIVLTGFGPGASIIKQGFAAASIDIQGVIENVDPDAGNQWITIRNLQILCTAPTGATPNLATSTCAVYFRGVQDVLIDGVFSSGGTLKFMPTTGTENTATVHANGKNSRVKVIRSRVQSSAEAVYFQQGVDLIAIGNHFLNAYDSTFSINSSGERIVIVDNVMDGQLNTFAALAHIELSNDLAGDTAGIRDVSIANNLLLNQLHSTAKGIGLTGVNNAAVSGNTIRNMNGRAIQISQDCAKVTVTGNMIDVPADGGHGIYIAGDGSAGCSDILVEGNTIYSVATGGNGISSGDGANTLVGVTVRGNRIKQTVNNAIRMDAAASGGIIEGNNLTGSANGVNLGSGTGWVFRNNAGYNPVGHGVSQPAVPASNGTYTNALGVDCSVYLTGGTVSAITLGTTATGLSYTGPASASVRVPVGQSIKLTYSAGTPVWNWFGD